MYRFPIYPQHFLICRAQPWYLLPYLAALGFVSLLQVEHRRVVMLLLICGMLLVMFVLLLPV